MRGPLEPTSAHRSLVIKEIWDEIVQRCTRPSLCALSRTCSVLSESALDELWRAQTGLQNLMSCLPSHLRKQGSRSLVSFRINIIRYCSLIRMTCRSLIIQLNWKIGSDSTTMPQGSASFASFEARIARMAASSRSSLGDATY